MTPSASSVPLLARNERWRTPSLTGNLYHSRQAAIARMTLPPLPPETALRAGETLLGQWDFEHDLKRSPVGHISALVLLTNQRLLLLELPTASSTFRVSGRMSRSGTKTLSEMGRWYVILDTPLKDLPEPSLGTQMTPTAIVSGPRVLSVGGRKFPVGNDPRADGMLNQIRTQWAAVRGERSEPQK